ncbi:Signal recognition particle protein [Amphibalanus amphitrite]|uniref:Signal recognition particle protein n=1 Tax=Amphibalanus amphitrite TaxID=1232801 RepID=A0A6A4V0X9_AMPAM|nr:Signal recognition particle protein [Amphibalanus amphitrite]
MSPSHKVDERALKNIINNNVIPSDDNTDINLVIYYKNRRTSNLFMKNNMNSPTDSLQRTCAVENPNYEEIRDVLSSAGLQVGVENKLYPRENSKELLFRGRIRVQLKQDNGKPVKPEFPSLD